MPMPNSALSFAPITNIQQSVFTSPGECDQGESLFLEPVFCFSIRRNIRSHRWRPTLKTARPGVCSSAATQTGICHQTQSLSRTRPHGSIHFRWRNTEGGGQSSTSGCSSCGASRWGWLMSRRCAVRIWPAGAIPRRRATLMCCLSWRTLRGRARLGFCAHDVCLAGHRPGQPDRHDFVGAPVRVAGPPYRGARCQSENRRLDCSLGGARLGRKRARLEPYCQRHTLTCSQDYR